MTKPRGVSAQAVYGKRMVQASGKGARRVFMLLLSTGKKACPVYGSLVRHEAGLALAER
ncbi:MAG: hypothetical protein GX776_09155 [Oxalobacter sp.]|nr:hypothetical protein [Oxalobacter sp.]